MKILLVHEYYRSSSPSGEDKVFEREKELLENNGLKVKTLIFRNDDIGTNKGPSVLKTAVYTPWSPLGQTLIKNAIQDFQPDIAHFHNTFPVFSQSAIVQAKKMGVATVQTFHNFRSICAQAMLLRDGICEECIGRYPFPALKYRCYRGSLMATLPLFLNIALHRLLRTWQNKIDRFVVLSEFIKSKFVDAGFPERKLKVKPNFYSSSIPMISQKNPKEWCFIGRLKEEKGVQFIPIVWKKLGAQAPVIHILGDGPLNNDFRKQIVSCSIQKKIIMHGHCSFEQVKKILERTSLLIFPSTCYEGFPLVIGEAYAFGVPVAASKIGTPQYIVKDGVTGIHFNPGDIEDMVSKLNKLLNNPCLLQKMSVEARKEYERYYTPEINFKIIMDIYQEALTESKRL